MIKKYFDFLKINKNELIGSAKYNIKYVSDYDLQEYIFTNDYDKLYEKFKDKYIMKPDIIITDFKNGYYKDEPIRWNKKSIIKGYVIRDKKKITFVDCLKMVNNTIKLDIVVKIDDDYIEITCNYYINKKKEDKKEDILKKLLDDMKDYYKEGLYLKMLKRLFSYMNLKNGRMNKASKKMKDEVFNNDDIGEMYIKKSRNETKIMLMDKKFIKKDNYKKLKEEVKEYNESINKKVEEWIDKL